MIDTVVFDMDGVLCRSHRQRRLDLLATWTGLEPAVIDERIFKSAFEEDAERGAWNPEDYLREFGRRLGHSLSLQQWVTARRAAMEPDHDVLGIASALARTCRIAMLTNNPLLLKRCFDVVFPEAASLFGDRAVFSAELGLRKPERAAFRSLMDRLGAAPATTLFFDDDPAYVDGARAAGLHAERFAGLAQLHAHLRSYGIDPSDER